MLSSNKIKFVNSLKSKKIRNKLGFFVAEGDKIVNDLINSDWEVIELFAMEGWIEKNQILDLEKRTNIYPVKYDELKKISSFKTPHNVLAIVKIPNQADAFVPQPGKLYLLLENIQDPGNLGAITRTSGWYGIDSIICSPGSVDIFNPKVIQASMNAFVKVEVCYHELRIVLEQFKRKDMPVYGTFMDGKNIYETPLTSMGAILFGNESKGISDDLIPFIKHHLHIPSNQEVGTTKVESLNIAAAVAVVCSEFRNLRK